MVFLHRQFFNKRFLLKYKVTTKRLWQIHGCTFSKYSERAFTKNYGKQTSILVGELPEESEQFRFFRASRLANLNLQILKVLFHIRNERWEVILYTYLAFIRHDWRQTSSRPKKMHVVIAMSAKCSHMHSNLNDKERETLTFLWWQTASRLSPSSSPSPRHLSIYTYIHTYHQETPPWRKDVANPVRLILRC
jgi:hypothetical protein